VESFRGEVEQSSHDASGGREQRRSVLFCQAQISKKVSTLLVKKDIGRFQISMKDSVVVKVFQGRGESKPKLGRLFHREGSMGANTGFQVAPPHPSQDQKGGICLGIAIVDRNQGSVRVAGKQLRLPHEA
jgi:hypothetical protein